MEECEFYLYEDKRVRLAFRNGILNMMRLNKIKRLNITQE
jgi:hypothetical protein